MEEDDMILVIVGEEDELKQNKVDNENPIEEQISVKEEVIDEETLEDVFINVEKYGQPIDLEEVLNLKQDPNYCEDELDNGAESELETQEERDDSVKKRTRFTKRLICDSYIQQSIKKCPELRHDEDALVKHLIPYMKNVKTPAIPSSAFKKDGTKFICNLCETTSNSESLAQKHFCEKHGPRYLMCLACGVDFRSMSNLYKHEMRCKAPHVSALLRARGRLIGNKARHRPFVHKSYVSKKLPCSYCPSVFSSRVSLSAHERLHLGLRPHVCDVCGAAYAAISALRRHQSKHLGARFECDHCGKRFNFKDSLVAHISTHLALKPFACAHSSCGRRYAHRSALRLHIRRVHLRLPHEHQCAVCEKRFPKMFMVKNHMNKKHGLSIMTRKMFLLQLPMLPNNHIEKAKVCFENNKDKGQKWIIEKMVREGENLERNRDKGSHGQGTGTREKSKQKDIMILENGKLKVISPRHENRKMYDEILRTAEEEH